MSPWRIKRSNMGKLREAARMAMDHPVMLSLDIDRLMTLSLAPWQRRPNVEAFERHHVMLGIFRADPGEGLDGVFARLLEEAVHAGALLPSDAGQAELMGLRP